MAAEIRVDTIKSRSGINTLSLAENSLNFIGSVGIGTTNPTAKLDVFGNAYINGNLGIGTANPVRKLEVHSDTSTTSPTQGSGIAVFLNTNTADNNYSSIVFNSADSTSVGRHGAAIGLLKDGTWTGGSGNYPGHLTFWTRPSSGDEIERVRITANGNFLVGSTSLRTNLGVNNDIPLAKIEGVGIGSTSTRGRLAIINNASTLASAAQLVLCKSYGSSVGSNSIVLDTDTLGNLRYCGNDGVNFIDAAGIQCQVDGNPGINSMPGRLLFNTTPIGSSSVTTRMVLNSYGNLLIGSGTSTGTGSQNLQVTGGAYVSGSVGIGTTNPNSQSKLNVYGSGRFSNVGSIYGEDLSTVPIVAELTSNPGETFFATINPYGYSSFAINLSGIGSTSTQRGFVQFFDKFDGNWRESIHLNTGRVGIGTTNAAAQNSLLGVAGTITELSSGQYWNIVSQADVGIGASQVPLNQYLGQLAFLDEYSPANLVAPRIQSVGEKSSIISGNTASLTYNTGGGNIAICTNPTGNITLAVTGIPTTSDFDNTSLTFSVCVNQTGTARSCTAVTLNGFSATIRWAGGSLGSAISGVTTTSGMDIYSFTGINTVGSESTTANYYVLGVVNGGYR